MRKLSDIIDICGGKLLCGDPETLVSDFVIDSRRVKPHSAFIALKGGKTDGRLYIPDAARNGASLCITEEDTLEDIPQGIAVLYCRDAVSALGSIAAYYRRKERNIVVGVTGSVGKTTVRQMCVSVLSQRKEVCFPEGNYNNLLGLPLTLLKDDGAGCAVVEVGISEPGEMERLSYICAPDIAIVTNIGTMHAETLGSRDDIAREKLKICSSMKKDGILIIPSDPVIKSEYTAKVNTFTVSDSKENSNYYITGNISCQGGRRLSLKKRGYWEYKNLFVPMIGQHAGIDAAFAAAAADMLGYTEDEIRAGLESYMPCGYRQKIEHKNGLTVISDCYNSGPASLKGALEAFEEAVRERETNGEKVKKVLLLGSMLELGSISRGEHLRLGRAAAGCMPDLLITFGDEAADFAVGAEESGSFTGKTISVRDESDILGIEKALSPCLEENAVVLIKGSRRLKMERFSEYLLTNRI